MKPRNLLEAVGASLLLIPVYYTFLLTPGVALYHHGLPVTHLVEGILLDQLFVVILAFTTLLLVERIPQRPRLVLMALVAGLMLWCIAEVIFRVGFQMTPPHSLALYSRWNSLALYSLWKKSREVLCILALLGFGMCAWFFPCRIEIVVRVARTLTAAFGCSALWIVPKLVYLSLLVPPVHLIALQPHQDVPAVKKARIVWLLFDELSYDQTFDHPKDGIDLPSFHRLHSESFSFSHLGPAGLSTEEVIPSLFLGRPVVQIRSADGSNLLYKEEERGQWMLYDPKSSLFGLAEERGWPSGIDGWYNPYCSILAPMVSDCFWQPLDALKIEQYGASESASALANAAVLPRLLVGFLTGRASFKDAHLRDYHNVMAHAASVIANPQLRFIFIHLPVPHPPGIYDRRSNSFRPDGTYLDNLVLADKTLDILLRQIDATSAASETTLIVSSDHSWRIPLWKPQPDWTQEEELASNGQFDQRPVLLVHFPNQTTSREIRDSLPELLEHDMIAAMLQDKIYDVGSLTTFLATRTRK